MARYRLMANMAFLAALAMALGAEAPQGQVTVSGRIGRSGQGATLTTPKGEVYQLVMDARGRSLAGVMHGVSAEVVAVPSERDGAKWLQVLHYVDEGVAAGHEYWRRMRCMACVVLPATRNAAVPANLRGATPIAGRHFPLKHQFTAWTRDAKSLWASADNELLEIALDAARVTRVFGRAEGLIDALIYQLLSDGRTVWIVHRGGVAALDVAQGRVRDLPRLKAAFARVHADAGGVWVVADTGTFRLRVPVAGDGRPGDEPKAFPALPTAEQIRRVVENGIWTAHWRRRTAHLIAGPATIGERLYVGSYGDLYELADGRWRPIAEGAWEQAAQGGKLWFLNAQGLGEYDPQTGKTAVAAPPESVQGHPSRLMVTEAAAWLALEPEGTGKDGPPTGGGIARFDLAKRTWQAWPKINDLSANAVACLTSGTGKMPVPPAVWVVTMEGRYKSRSAHPGMTTTTRLDFDATGFALHRYDEKAGKWDSYPLAMPDLEKRLICGQDGQHSPDVVAPQFIEELSVGPRRIFALARLMPKQFFGGYWPCVEQVASRPAADAAWAAAFVHHPDQLGLQGEQPLVLNISSGELTRIGSSLKDQRWEAVGHDLVLGLFALGGRHWAVTESCIAFFDEAEGKWTRLAEPDFRWYWRATAALDDGRSLIIGSDRGLVCRLDLASDRFEPLVALKDRSISRIVRGEGGALIVVGAQAPLGRFPVQLGDTLKPMDCDAVRSDGNRWVAVKAEDLPAAAPAPQWAFKQFERKDHLDKSQGNYLCGPPDGQPRYYVKEVFFPQFLCASADGRRMWLSTYTGILRLDIEAK